MEFIKRIKKREFIELGLKALGSILLAFVAIILMEGMIYGIEMHSMMTDARNNHHYDTSVAYCIERSNDKYFVLYHNDQDGATSWTAVTKLYSKAELQTEVVPTVSKVIYHAPNAFEFSITPVHYPVMVVFVLLVAGYFVWRFVLVSKEYKRVEEKFKKTGEIEIAS